VELIERNQATLQLILNLSPTPFHLDLSPSGSLQLLFGLGPPFPKRSQAPPELVELPVDTFELPEYPVSLASELSCLGLPGFDLRSKLFEPPGPIVRPLSAHAESDPGHPEEGRAFHV
jgi:hypothetical protein